MYSKPGLKEDRDGDVSTEPGKTLAELTELPGIELPDIHFPLRCISEIIEDDLSNELAPSQREFLIKLFNNIKNVISQYSWDVGRIRDYTGQPINMKIPLKRPLPRLSKAYKLSEDEENSLNDILNFLIYFWLAENVDLNYQQGKPSFLSPKT